MNTQGKTKAEIQEQSIMEMLDGTDYLCDISINVPECGFEDEYEIQEEIEKGIDNQLEVIYYHKAMEFLMKEDSSLNESMDLASAYCYTPENINSELLATLLLQQRASEELYDLDFSELFEL